MTLELDLTDVEAWEGTTILTPGEYDVAVDDAKEGTSSGGYPQLELQLHAVSGEQQGGQIRDWIIVTAQSAGRVKQVLLALGVPADGKVKLEASDLIGKRCHIIVRNEPGQDGKDRSRVKAYLPASGRSDAAGNGKSDDAALPF